MKIYNVLKVPQGLGYDEVDYDALYQSGYTTGHQSGYTDGLNDCFYVDKEGVYFGYAGGSEEVTVKCHGEWYISGDTTGFYVSALSGDGNGSFIVSAASFSDPCSCDVSVVKELTITNEYGKVIPFELVHDGEDMSLHGLYYDFISASGASFIQDEPLQIGFPSTGGTYRLEVWFGNATAATDQDFSCWAPYSTATITPKPGPGNRWYVDVNVGAFEDEEWDGNRPGSRMLEISYNYCHLCSHTDRIYIPASVATIPRPELYVTTDMPIWSPGMDYNVPSTGGTYQFTVSSTTEWSGNTVNISQASYGITLSQTSGQSGTTVVTATIPANTDSQNNNFVIEFGVTSGQSSDLPTYASFYIVQGAPAA